MTEELARVRSYDGLIEAFRARKDALGLSDAALDARAFLTPGHTGKLLGRSRERGIGAATLEALMDALGVSFIMVADPEKLAAGGELERGMRSHARTNHPRVGKSAIKLVRPIVLRDAARKAAHARWRDSTPEARAAFVAMLNAARAAKRARRHARMKDAA